MPSRGRQIAIDYVASAEAKRLAFAKNKANPTSYKPDPSLKQYYVNKPAPSAHAVSKVYTDAENAAYAGRQAVLEDARKRYEELKNIKYGTLCTYCNGDHHYTKCAALQTIADKPTQAKMFCVSGILHGFYSSGLSGRFREQPVDAQPNMYFEFSRAVSVEFDNSTDTEIEALYTYKNYSFLIKFPRAALFVDNAAKPFVDRLVECAAFNIVEPFKVATIYSKKE